MTLNEREKGRNFTFINRDTFPFRAPTTHQKNLRWKCKFQHFICWDFPSPTEKRPPTSRCLPEMSRVEATKKGGIERRLAPSARVFSLHPSTPTVFWFIHKFYIANKNDDRKLQMQMKGIFYFSKREERKITEAHDDIFVLAQMRLTTEDGKEIIQKAIALPSMNPFPDVVRFISIHSSSQLSHSTWCL